MTGIAQLAFKDKANGSLITRNGHVIGSRLAAQEFTKPEYFHERPSATVPAYNAAGTTFSNFGPDQPGAHGSGEEADRRDHEAGEPV